MSTTPQTDALDEISVGYSDEQTVKAYKKLAREIEADLTAENARLRAASDHMAACRAEVGAPDDDVLLESIRQLKANLAAAREELAAIEGSNLKASSLHEERAAKAEAALTAAQTELKLLRVALDAAETGCVKLVEVSTDLAAALRICDDMLTTYRDDKAEVLVTVERMEAWRTDRASINAAKEEL